jgi:hypothetical protein
MELVTVLFKEVAEAPRKLVLIGYPMKYIMGSTQVINVFCIDVITVDVSTRITYF